jgi:anthranilate phosphoribosyltransferase
LFETPDNPVMSISTYIKDIGRGKEGARSLSRAQATDLMGQVLDGTVTDLEVGAFCLAMRIKGETPEEMAGFLDATHARLNTVPAQAPNQPTVVLPSYNGARRLPVLTPLLALLLAREGVAVLVHGSDTEDKRISTQKVLLSLVNQGVAAITESSPVTPGTVSFWPTPQLLPGLDHLLQVRRVVGLRNPAHSLVKLMQPVAGAAVLVSSYTHPEYLRAMTDTLTLTGTRALLLRGTEGEAVADARRTPAMDAFDAGVVTRVQDAQEGPLAQLPQLPAPDANSTADWIVAVLAGQAPVPPPIARQVQHILALVHSTSAVSPTPALVAT